MGMIAIHPNLNELLPDKSSGTIKEQLEAIAPALELLWKQKEERKRDFYDVRVHIQNINGEIVGTCEKIGSPLVDEAHLFLNKLSEFQSQLQELQKEKLQELATQLTDLWNLIDTPDEERNMTASVDEVTVSSALALESIEQTEVDVERLDQLKASKMKEIAFKRQGELEEIFVRAREKILELIDSGNVEPTELLADMDNQILKAKEEAASRKDILDKVERWMSACEEESWLEDYNRVILLSFFSNKLGV